jgi:hypothetical protein
MVLIEGMVSKVGASGEEGDKRYCSSENNKGGSSGPGTSAVVPMPDLLRLCGEPEGGVVPLLRGPEELGSQEQQRAAALASALRPSVASLSWALHLQAQTP